MGARPEPAHTESLTILQAGVTNRLLHTVSRTTFGKPGTHSRLPWEAAVVVLGYGQETIRKGSARQSKFVGCF